MASQLRVSGVSVARPVSFLPGKSLAAKNVRVSRPGALQPAPRRRVGIVRAANPELHCNCRELPDGSLLFTFTAGTSKDATTHVVSSTAIGGENGIPAEERIQDGELPRLVEAAKDEDLLSAGPLVGLEGAAQLSDSARDADGDEGASVGDFPMQGLSLQGISVAAGAPQMQDVVVVPSIATAPGISEGSESVSVRVTPGFKEFNVQVMGGRAVVTMGGVEATQQADSLPHQLDAFSAGNLSSSPAEVEAYPADSAADVAVHASVQECESDSQGSEVAGHLGAVASEPKEIEARMAPAPVHDVGALVQAVGQVQQDMEEQRDAEPLSSTHFHAPASLGANNLSNQMVASIACRSDPSPELSSSTSSTLLRNGGYTPLMLLLAVGPLVVHLVRRMLKENVVQGLGAFSQGAKDPQEVQRVAREALDELGRKATAGGRAVAGWYADAVAQMGKPDGSPVENFKKLFMRWSTPLEVNVAAVAVREDEHAAAVGGDRETYGAWAAVATPVSPAETPLEVAPREVHRPATEARTPVPVVPAGKQDAGEQEVAPTLAELVAAPQEEILSPPEVPPKRLSSFRKASPILAMKQLGARKARVAEQIRAAEAALRPPMPAPPPTRVARPPSRFMKPSPVVAARAAAERAEERTAVERGIHLRRPHKTRSRVRARIPRPTLPPRISSFRKPSPIAAFRARQMHIAKTTPPTPSSPPTELKAPAVPRPASSFAKPSPVASWRTRHRGMPSSSSTRRLATAAPAPAAPAADEDVASLEVVGSTKLPSEVEQPAPQAAVPIPGLTPVRPPSSFKKVSPILSASAPRPASQPDVARKAVAEAVVEAVAEAEAVAETGTVAEAVAEAAAVAEEGAVAEAVAETGAEEEAASRTVRAPSMFLKPSPVAAARARNDGRTALLRQAAASVLPKGGLADGEAKEGEITAQQDALSDIPKRDSIGAGIAEPGRVSSAASDPSLRPDSAKELTPATKPEESNAEVASGSKGSELTLESAQLPPSAPVLEDGSMLGSTADSVASEQSGVPSAAASVAAQEPLPGPALSTLPHVDAVNGLTAGTPLAEAAGVSAPEPAKAKAPRSRSRKAKAAADGLDPGADAVAEAKARPARKARAATSAKAGADKAVALEGDGGGAEGGLGALTLVALKEMAKARGLKGYSKLKKADLVALLEQSDPSA